MLRRLPLFAFVTSAALAAPAFSAERTRDSSPSASANPSIRMSHETTRFSGPLDADGYVDFVAAVNDHYAKNVPLSQNAAELLLEAIGPGENEGAINQVRAALGMSPVGKGPFIVRLPGYASADAALQKQM